MTKKTQPAKKRKNAADLTRRNLIAAAKRHADITERLDAMDDRIHVLELHYDQRLDIIDNRLDAIERRQEADSRQQIRAERDNIEGGQTPEVV